MINKYKAILFNDTTNELHHGCTVVIKNITIFFENINVEIVKYFPSGVDHTNNINLNTYIKNTDLVIINGEGTIHHNQKQALWLLNYSKISKLYGKKTILINSIFDTQNKEFFYLAKNFDFISVRDNASKYNLERNGIKSVFVPDFTFYKISSYKFEERKHIGFTDSINLNLTKSLFNKFNRQYQFMPILSPPYFNKINIINTLRKFKFLIKKIFYNFYKTEILNFYDIRFYGDKNYEKYIKKIALSKFMIIARYHTLCFAIQNGVPFIAFESNSKKISSLLNDIGIKGRIVDINKLDNLDFNSYETLNKIEINLIDKFIKESKNKFEQLSKDINFLLKNDK